MHWRVFESQCNAPMPNFHSAPRKAISSVQICPVLRNATLSGPCWSMMALNLNVKTCIAWSQSVGSSLPVFGWRSSGVVARSGAASGVRASQPFGQAMPRFTG